MSMPALVHHDVPGQINDQKHCKLSVCARTSSSGLTGLMLLLDEQGYSLGGDFTADDFCVSHGMLKAKNHLAARLKKNEDSFISMDMKTSGGIIKSDICRGRGDIPIETKHLLRLLRDYKRSNAILVWYHASYFNEAGQESMFTSLDGGLRRLHLLDHEKYKYVIGKLPHCSGPNRKRWKSRILKNTFLDDVRHKQVPLQNRKKPTKSESAVVENHGLAVPSAKTKSAIAERSAKGKPDKNASAAKGKPGSGTNGSAAKGKPASFGSEVKKPTLSESSVEGNHELALPSAKAKFATAEHSAKGKPGKNASAAKGKPGSGTNGSAAKGKLASAKGKHTSFGSEVRVKPVKVSSLIKYKGHGGDLVRYRRNSGQHLKDSSVGSLHDSPQLVEKFTQSDETHMFELNLPGLLVDFQEAMHEVGEFEKLGWHDPARRVTILCT